MLVFMLTVEEKILLLDEVVNVARCARQILLVGHEDFGEWPQEDRSHPAYFGYRALENALGMTLITAFYSLVETGKRSYSFHHAVSDPELNVSSVVKKHCERCFELRSKISTYRNNVAAHVNAKKTQSDWAQVAGITNGEIDAFLRHAKTAITELAKDNLGKDFSLGITMPVRHFFREYCRMTAKLEYERRRDNT